MKLYKASFFLILVLVFSRVVGIAQNISGKVINTQSGKAIRFVSISIEGTTLGTITDFEGVFELEIPIEYENGQLLVSCVGFKDKKIYIKDIFEKSNLKFRLEASSVDIDEVVVVQKSLYPYTIIKNVIRNIKYNYINVPYNYELYYLNIDKLKNDEELKRELVVLLYDNNGYSRTSIYNTFKSINYMFKQSKRNFDVKYLNDGNTNIDNLLEFDIVRHKGNVLDNDRIYDYDIAIKDNIIYKGDSVWVLSYTSKKPNFISTGSYYANFYSGEIFIKKSNYAVLYNKTTVKCSNFSRISRNLYVNDKQNKKNAVYNFEVFYKQQKDYYILDKIDYNLSNGDLNRESKIRVLKLYIEKPHKIYSRAYYEDLDFDKSFWKNFKH